MGKESIVEINGHQYRYEYVDGETKYVGPVGDAPLIKEAEFMAAMPTKITPLTGVQHDVLSVIRNSIVPPTGNAEVRGFGIERERGGLGIYHPWHSAWGEEKSDWRDWPEGAEFEVWREEVPFKIGRTMKALEKKGIIEIVYEQHESRYGINITAEGKRVLEREFMGPTTKPNWPKKVRFIHVEDDWKGKWLPE